MTSNNDLVGLDGALLRVVATEKLVSTKVVSERRPDDFFSRIRSLKVKLPSGARVAFAPKGFMRTSRGGAALLTGLAFPSYVLFENGTVTFGADEDDVAALLEDVTIGATGTMAFRKLSDSTAGGARRLQVTSSSEYEAFVPGTTNTCPAGSYTASDGTDCELVRVCVCVRL